MCFNRSKSSPLTVSLSDFDGWSSNTIRMVGSHADRFKELTLSGSLSSSISEIYTSLVPGKGPLLRELIIFGDGHLDPASWATHKSLFSPIISEDIPTLRRLLLSSFPLTPQLSALRHLTSIDLADPGPTANTVLDLLANNPVLQEVEISGPLGNQRSPREGQSITLPHLRHLLVFRCSAIDILRCLHLPHSEPLEMDIDFSFVDAPLPRVY